MDAKKCDRCKKYYDKYEGIYKRGKNGNVVQRFKIPCNQLFISNSIYNEVPDIPFDLCPDCMMELNKWLNKKGE